MSEDLAELLSQLGNEDYCYLTTKGRVSGHPHEIEIWFGSQNNRVYLLAGSNKLDWVKNLLKEPNVTVQIAHHVYSGTAHTVKDEKEEMAARHLLAEKYQEWEQGRKLSEWARTALVVGIELLST